MTFLLLGEIDSLQAAPRWWKGNLHTHSFWSDGDDYPEVITAWYRTNGYNFLGISDHNTLHTAFNRWIPIPSGTNQPVFRKYLNQFGPDWVDQRMIGTNLEARLKTLSEYRGLF